MTESTNEGLNHQKDRFNRGINLQGKELSNDEKVSLAANISQKEFINNYYSTSGIDYINKALNWPPTYEKTVQRKYPNISMREHMVALATYELLESCSGGVFAPTESAAIIVHDASRFADKLESKKDMDISEFGDILFTRFANAIVGLAGFRSKESRDEIFNELQETISKVDEVYSLSIGGGHGQIDDLVELFNRTEWNMQSLLEGKPMHLVENMFRAYQGSTLRLH